jgi:hypothetical protein
MEPNVHKHIIRTAIACAFAVTVATTNAQPPLYSPTYLDPLTSRGYTCFARTLNGQLELPVPGMNDDGIPYWGYATYNQSGLPFILFNISRLSQYPAIVTRFTYYHECAHLQIPTSNEIDANCTALRNMRANGDLTAREEELVEMATRSTGILAPQYGGSGDAFWDATIACAGERS